MEQDKQFSLPCNISSLVCQAFQRTMYRNERILLSLITIGLCLDRLFNILCPYGNVRRIKFLKTKEGAAMVEMGEPESCQRVMHNLHHSQLFGNKLQFQPSKQQVLLEVNSPFELSDGTPSYKDFSSSRNNRYSNPTMAAKNRVFPPSRTLHFWNVPPSYTEDDILHLFERFADISMPE